MGRSCIQSSLERTCSTRNWASGEEWDKRGHNSGNDTGKPERQEQESGRGSYRGETPWDLYSPVGFQPPLIWSVGFLWMLVRGAEPWKNVAAMRPFLLHHATVRFSRALYAYPVKPAAAELGRSVATEWARKRKREHPLHWALTLWGLWRRNNRKQRWTWLNLIQNQFLYFLVVWDLIRCWVLTPYRKPHDAMWTSFHFILRDWTNNRMGNLDVVEYSG